MLINFLSAETDLNRYIIESHTTELSPPSDDSSDVFVERLSSVHRWAFSSAFGEWEGQEKATEDSLDLDIFGDAGEDLLGLHTFDKEFDEDLDASFTEFNVDNATFLTDKSGTGDNSSSMSVAGPSMLRVSGPSNSALLLALSPRGVNT